MKQYALVLSLLTVVWVLGCSTVRWQGRDPERATLPVSSSALLAGVGLVRIEEVDPSIFIDLRYKTESAIARRPLYEADFPALLRPETAVRLKRANELVKAQGYRIKVWDAYRPPAAQRMLWDASGHDDRFVANPDSAPSQHSCGTAVDVTLVKANGEEVEMPTGFDSFTPRAAARFSGLPEQVQKNREILQVAMSEAGFFILPNEWWHFTDRRFRDYPETVALSDIQASWR